jgi:hypothetical protein
VIHSPHGSPTPDVSVNADLIPPYRDFLLSGNRHLRCCENLPPRFSDSRSAMALSARPPGPCDHNTHCIGASDFSGNEVYRLCVLRISDPPIPDTNWPPVDLPTPALAPMAHNLMVIGKSHIDIAIPVALVHELSKSRTPIWVTPVLHCSAMTVSSRFGVSRLSCDDFLVTENPDM